ncbi:hypothetical protein HZY62_21485 [Maribacter polysiphoniae]|uniref:RDD family protein n=1 Tax=Maribacter polysiphoniae TaxID=429344 RepID=A0A316E697_9FLAO|nr:hypothetical protein [Maribacter polysiphoniae]PWK18460.1 hypothetical protein LX92_04334 [Maribacter polysiphoniae]
MAINIGDQVNIALSNRLKLNILFVDFIIFSFLFLTIEGMIYSQVDFDRVFPWLFRLLIYFMFFTLSELLFNRTLGMRLFKVSLVNKKRGELSKAFVKYSFLVVLDRFILIILLYFFRIFFHSKKNLLISEKYSGLRWSRKQY